MAAKHGKSRGSAQQFTASDSDVRTLPLSAIVLSGKNPREHFDPDRIRDLAESIREVGLLQPILVRPLDDDHWELVCGERRFKAVELLEWESLPATVRELTDAEAAALRLLENVDRLDLNGCEEATAIRQLRELGHDTASLSNLLRRTETDIESREGLADLPLQWQSLIKSGDLSAAHAEYLVPWVDRPAVLEALEPAANRLPMPLLEWSRRIRETVRSMSRSLDDQAPDGPTFLLTDELYDRLDVAQLDVRPGEIELRAFNVQLWDSLADEADAAAETDDVDPSHNGHARNISSPADPAGGVAETGDECPLFDDAYWSRLTDWKAEWLRSLIVTELCSRCVDELEGFLDLLGIDPADEWALSREFLMQHNDRQLQALADELGIDLSDADNADEMRAILLHVAPQMMPENVTAVSDREREQSASPVSAA